VFIGIPWGTIWWDPKCFAMSSVSHMFGCTPGQLFDYQEKPGLGTPNSLYQYQGNMTVAEIQENNAGDPEMFIYSRPYPGEDASKSFRCTLTGWYAAGHDKVIVDGAPYIREFARLPESRRLQRNKRPKTWPH
jgi:hypothetical protein